MYTYDIEQLLKDGSAIRLKPQGYSMYPLFHPGRDEAVIEAYPIHLLRRGDVILYRREQSILVSHPVYRMLSSLWLFLRPIRPFFWRIMALFRKISSGR